MVQIRTNDSRSTARRCWCSRRWIPYPKGPTAAVTDMHVCLRCTFVITTPEYLDINSVGNNARSCWFASCCLQTANVTGVFQRTRSIGTSGWRFRDHVRTLPIVWPATTQILQPVYPAGTTIDGIDTWLIAVTLLSCWQLCFSRQIAPISVRHNYYPGSGDEGPRHRTSWCIADGIHW